MYRCSTLLVSLSFALCACDDFNRGSTPSTSSSSSPTAYTCPTSDDASSEERGIALGIPASSSRMPIRASGVAERPALLAVTYDASSLAANRTRAAAREAALGASLLREYNWRHAGTITRVVRAPSDQIEAVANALRSQPGVRSVGLTGYHRHLDTVTTPYFTSDPYFVGLTEPGPLYQSQATEGQWNMHVTRLEYAFGYSQSGNGSAVSNPAALGSSAIRIAMIDTGEDPNHPELSTQITYQRCFITDPSGTQSSSDFETDPNGHGTGTSGVAAAASNNGFGFTGSGGAATIAAYRVFPTPDDNCSNEKSTDSRCLTDPQDIASAIEDAVSQGVNVISLSLGGDPCTTAGSDPDSLEGSAIADAVAANVIVVSAAGNDGTQGTEAPACDSGVIAVGATGLSDGSTNGSGNTGGTTAIPKEYVANYSDYGSPGAAAGSSSAWGIVAPGGDPQNDKDTDYLHWIDTIWTTTPYDSNFAGTCTTDASGSGIDCRTLLAGTSLATPQVAGAAALILAVNSSYQSPAKMKALLCGTADDIGDPHEGCGRLDIDRAMAVAIGDPAEPAGRPVP